MAPAIGVIIVFGVLKLLERASAKPGAPPPYSGGYSGQYPGQPGGQAGGRPPGGNAI